jgi:GAF domain-containing protein
MVERILHKNYDLLQAIHTAQSAFIDRSESLSNILQKLLKKVMEITESEYGYIGKLTDAHLPDIERSILKPLVVADYTGNLISAAPSISKYSSVSPAKVTSLLDGVKKSGQALLLEDISTDGKRPCPFVGVPLIYKQQLIGVIGLAGCRIGYPDNIVTFMAPLAEACAAMIHVSSSISTYPSNNNRM